MIERSTIGENNNTGMHGKPASFGGADSVRGRLRPPTSQIFVLRSAPAIGREGGLIAASGTEAERKQDREGIKRKPRAPRLAGEI